MKNLIKNRSHLNCGLLQIADRASGENMKKRSQKPFSALRAEKAGKNTVNEFALRHPEGVADRAARECREQTATILCA